MKRSNNIHLVTTDFGVEVNIPMLGTIGGPETERSGIRHPDAHAVEQFARNLRRAGLLNDDGTVKRHAHPKDGISQP